MSDLWIFLLGVIVTATTILATLQVGRDEAEDPALNRNEDAADIA